MITKRCKQCGKIFTINESEIDFFKSKNLELPKRCSQCRKENKRNKQNNAVNIDKNIDSSNYTFEKGYLNSKINKKGKRNTFRNVIIAILVFASLLIGKLLNIEPNWFNIASSLQNDQSSTSLEFRTAKQWEEHFEKHRNEFRYKTKEEYLKGARDVVMDSNSLHKKESEDGDDIYYDEKKNEIVFVSKDGYIRTYFKPTEGVEYFNRQ